LTGDPVAFGSASGVTITGTHRGAYPFHDATFTVTQAAALE